MIGRLQFHLITRAVDVVAVRAVPDRASLASQSKGGEPLNRDFQAESQLGRVRWLSPDLRMADPPRGIE